MRGQTGMSERPVVAVIGAGMGGLCAARALRQSGAAEVVVYERAGRAGGVLQTSRVQGFAREHAANAFLPVRGGTGALDLARELGLELVEAAPAARKRWIYRRGRLRVVPASPRELVTTDLLSWRGKLAALAEPLRAPGYGEESVFSFARRRLGHEVAEAIVAPFVTGVFAGNADELSVQAGFPALAALEAQGGLVVGQARAMARVLRGRLRGAQAADRPPRVRTRLAAPAGGVQALIDALARELGSAVVTGKQVSAIEPGPWLRFADGSAERVAAVVLATPAHEAAELVAGASAVLAHALSSIPYAPIAVVYLGARRADIAHPLDGFGFLVAPGEELRLLGTVFESVLWADRAPAGHVLLRCMFGGARDPSALELDDDALVAAARADLDRALGGFAGVELVHRDVVRWPRAIAQYTLGHEARVERAEALAWPLGITLAGSAYHGVAVNRIVADAGRVARAVLDQLGVVMAALLAVLLLACASGSKSAGDALGAEAAPPAMRDGSAGQVAAPEDMEGRVTVTVTWLDAPATARAPAGTNACGHERAAPVVVHTLGGVQSAVVRLEPTGAAPAGGRSAGERAGDASADRAPVVAVRDCSLAPRVGLLPPGGREIRLRNDDEQRHRVTVRPAGTLAAAPAADTDAPADALAVALPLMGAQVAVPVAGPGVWQVGVAADPVMPAYVVAAAHAHVGLTDATGVARFRVAPGSYDVIAWHAPVEAGGAPIEARQSIVVTAEEPASAIIALGGAR